MSDISDFYMDWESDSIEITSRSVEKILEPLVYQVSLLVSYRGSTSSRKKGQSKPPDSILKSIKDMTADFMSRGEEIMLEAPERQRDFRAALQDVERSGKDLYRTAELFLMNSGNIDFRKSMINAMKATLSSVTRLMILADIVDIYVLLRAANRVLADIDTVKESPDLQTLAINWNSCDASISDLVELVGIRQRDLIEDRKRAQMAAARSMLRTQAPLLPIITKVCIRHPELSSATANRDYVVKTLCDALNLINTAIKGSSNNNPLFYEIPGEIANALDNFDKHAVIKLDKYTDTEGTSLATKLKRIVTDCSVLVSSPCTRQMNKDAIVAEGKNAEKNCQNLINVYQACANRMSSTNELRAAQSKMLKSTEKLLMNLKSAVADHISDTFFDIEGTLSMLLDTAESGNEDNFESVAPFFSETVAKMVEVAKLACTVSLNYDGVKMTRLSANNVEQLYPEVVNAARILALRPSSEFAVANMNAFKSHFLDSLATLSDAVDNITNIRDFLSVIDAHVSDDIKACIASGKAGSSDDFQQNVIVLRNRVIRACATVHGEMDNFRQSEYRQRVEDCLRDLETQIIPSFDNFVGACFDKLNKGARLDESQFLDGLGDIYDGIHEVWQAVVLGRDHSGYETEPMDSYDSGAESKEERIATLDNPKSEKAVMKIIAGQHNEVLDKEMAGFFEQRKRLIHETTKWDDSGNEIVLISKKMCKLIADMTDFTRGMGPLKSASDVMESAAKVLEYGGKLNNVLTTVLKECPGSSHKSDLEKDMERVALYCHQMKITSRVSADIQSIGDEIVVSGLESVTTLIETSRNLIAAVVDTVKSSYIATTKYKGTNLQATIQWRMKAPKKKPLVHKVKSDDHDTLKSPQRFGKMDPMYELNQFDH